jgi:hypothetical protein
MKVRTEILFKSGVEKVFESDFVKEDLRKIKIMIEGVEDIIYRHMKTGLDSGVVSMNDFHIRLSDISGFRMTVIED